MGINSILKIGGEMLTQVRKAYVKPMCKVTTPETLGIKIKQLSGDVVQLTPQSKNTIMMKEVHSGILKFYEGGEYIGRASVGVPPSDFAPVGLLPKSWYIPNGVLNEAEKMPTYPRLYIDEFMMADKLGFFEEYKQRASGKKYGVMCMQKILEYAEKNGYGTRIYLGPAKHGSNIHPGKFYAKIGFEPGPSDIEWAQKCNKRIKYAEEHPELPEEIRKSLLDTPYHEHIDGRFVATESFAGTVYLTHPEVLRNYPL